MKTFDIENYLQALIRRLQDEFGKRLIYVGLQGSFRRCEADENSDIDIMVTLDRLDAADLDCYRGIIAALPAFERSCGFISGRAELKNWPRHEICQLLHETRDCYGSLRPLLPDYGRADVENYIRISISNLYHLLCHGRIHGAPEECADRLRGLYKPVFYILQNSFYLQTGEWVMTRAELATRLAGPDRDVMQMALTVRSGAEFDTEKAFSLLFDWCRNFLQ
ncbi:MAG: nucleotidyltransferase domain-containing protein [Lentisphaeria bacterium]|nr:nucleotidyltransferase domain-containing protein [Lentisphaeria bacterium]